MEKRQPAHGVVSLCSVQVTGRDLRLLLVSSSTKVVPQALRNDAVQSRNALISRYPNFQRGESGVLHTDETTALGEPRPGSEGRQIAVRQAPSTGAALLSLVAAGAGIGFVFALFGRMF